VKCRTKQCLLCGGRMVGGMLPGWWMCRCGFFMDVQEAGCVQLLQYSVPKNGWSSREIVSKGCLLVVEGRVV